MVRVYYQYTQLLVVLLFGVQQSCQGDKVNSQLPDWRNSHLGLTTVATNQEGRPVRSLTASLSVGLQGPILLHDTNLINHLAHFARERIPERVVHAKGAGALGYFEVTHDITKFTKARVFSEIGKKTPVTVRFSRTVGERGSADTNRDTRGMALKFQTEDGIWDMAGLSIEAFFIADPILFPSMVHAFKRNPQTGVVDFNMFWDFVSLRPESSLAVLLFMSDKGIPDGYRHMDGFSVSAFKMVNSSGDAVYTKFHWTTDQGEKYLNSSMATILAGVDSDYATRDLYDAIANDDFPSWTLSIQVMTFAEAQVYKWNPFDATKTWFPQAFPLIPVGKLVLDRNPNSYYAEVEQVAFSPGNLVPGIEVSPDKLLQGRFFSYPDTARYRLGSNFLQLPINYPVNSVMNTYARDGAASCGGNGGGSPNYYPNSFNGPYVDEINAEQSVYNSPLADVHRRDLGTDHFSQATIYWNDIFSEDEKKRIVANIVPLFKLVTDDGIRSRVLSNFKKISPELLNMLNTDLKASGA